MKNENFLRKTVSFDDKTTVIWLDEKQVKEKIIENIEFLKVLHGLPPRNKSIKTN